MGTTNFKNVSSAMLRYTTQTLHERGGGGGGRDVFMLYFRYLILTIMYVCTVNIAYYCCFTVNISYYCRFAVNISYYFCFTVNISYSCCFTVNISYYCCIIINEHCIECG